MSKFIEDVLAQHKKAMTAFPDNVLAKEFVDKFFDFLFIPHPQRKQSIADFEKVLTDNPSRVDIAALIDQSKQKLDDALAKR